MIVKLEFDMFYTTIKTPDITEKELRKGLYNEFEKWLKKHKTLPLKTIIRRMLVNYLCDLCCTVISSGAFEFFTNSIFSALSRKF